MLRLVVVDRSAESRHRLVGELNRLFGSDLPDLAFVPRVSVTPTAIHELKFQAVPDICIVGREFVEGTLSEIAELRRFMPEAVILAELPTPSPGIGGIERLARLGFDDVLAPDFGSSELLQKLVLHVRRRGVGKRGQLVVVGSGKGGLGVTSVAVGLAERSARAGEKTVIVDFDVETQDAARFLHARPYVNETLQSIFDQQKPLTPEFVEESIVSVERGDCVVQVMPPLLDSEGLCNPLTGYARTLVSLLEVLDTMFDVTVVDLGSARGAVLEVFHRTADVAVLVVSPDPAALYPSIERARRMRASLGGTARIVVVENRVGSGGLPSRFVHREISRAVGGLDQDSRGLFIPYCSRAAMWPGSGETIYRCGRPGVRRGLEALWREVADERGSAVARSVFCLSTVRSTFERIRSVVDRRRGRGAVGYPSSRLPTPPEKSASKQCAQRELPPPSHEVPLDPRALISGFREPVEGVS